MTPHERAYPAPLTVILDLRRVTGCSAEIDEDAVDKDERT
jgi:hypothetical protein